MPLTPHTKRQPPMITPTSEVGTSHQSAKRISHRGLEVTHLPPSEEAQKKSSFSPVEKQALRVATIVGSHLGAALGAIVALASQISIYGSTSATPIEAIIGGIATGAVVTGGAILVALVTIGVTRLANKAMSTTSS